jgi:hypothetical protein
MYTIDSSLYQNVNHFLRRFPISMIAKFITELRGLLLYVYLLQSSIECLSCSEPLCENLIVYRGIAEGPNFDLLYESIIGDVVVWPGFTSTSTNRGYVLDHFITDDNSLLIEIELHPRDVAVMIKDYSEYELEGEVLIAASTGFKVVSVDYENVLISTFCDTPTLLPIVKLSYFLHWYDFDLDQRPPRVLF